MKRIQAAVVGASGYSGAELTRLLRGHPQVRSPRLFRLGADDAGASDALRVNGGAAIERFDWDAIEREHFDILFFCTPHEVSRELIPRAIARGSRVVDQERIWGSRSFCQATSRPERRGELPLPRMAGIVCRGRSDAAPFLLGIARSGVTPGPRCTLRVDPLARSVI